MTKASTQRGDAANGRVSLGKNTEQKTIGQTRSTYGGNEALSTDYDPSQPILMMDTQDVQNVGPGRWRGNNVQRGKGGIERLPAVSHVTDDFRTRTEHPRARTRYRTMLTHDGNERTITHSNGAAHMPVIEEGRWSRDGWAQHMVNKGIALGWIDVNAGCVKRQIADKLVDPNALIERDKIAAMPVCARDAKTCKHLEIERTARKAQHNAEMDRLEADARRGEDRQAEALAAAVAKGIAAHMGTK